jgi:hypothetical protein
MVVIILEVVFGKEVLSCPAPKARSMSPEEQSLSNVCSRDAAPRLSRVSSKGAAISQNHNCTVKVVSKERMKVGISGTRCDERKSKRKERRLRVSSTASLWEVVPRDCLRSGRSRNHHAGGKLIWSQSRNESETEGRIDKGHVVRVVVGVTMQGRCLWLCTVPSSRLCA